MKHNNSRHKNKRDDSKCFEMGPLKAHLGLLNQHDQIEIFIELTK